MENNENIKHIQKTSSAAMILCLLSLMLKIISAVMGRTALQYVDAVRCFIETSVVVLWWYICKVKNMNISVSGKNRFNLSVRISMICLAVVMTVFAVIRYKNGAEESGSLYLGLLISTVGGFNNAVISRRYIKKADGDESVKRQGTLFSVKSFADLSVAVTLACVMLFPDSEFTLYLRFITSVAVSFAMALGGILRK